MKPLQKSLNDHGGSAILLSVKPRFADLIVAGEKRVEFRRAVPSAEIGLIVVYSSAPTKAIVAVATVKATVCHRMTKLWAISRELGGGLTRAELHQYFSNRDSGYAILLDEVYALPQPISPASFIQDFRAPQSFRYLSATELDSAFKALGRK